jgi:hypothetical protein
MFGPTAENCPAKSRLCTVNAAMSATKSKAMRGRGFHWHAACKLTWFGKCYFHMGLSVNLKALYPLACCTNHWLF